MKTATKRCHKHLLLEPCQEQARPKSFARQDRTQSPLSVDFAIAEHKKNHLVQRATEHFIKSGVEIKGVHGTLVG